MITNSSFKINSNIEYKYRQNGYFVSYVFQIKLFKYVKNRQKADTFFVPAKNYIKIQNKFDFFSLTALVNVFLILNLTLSPKDDDV